MAIYIPTTDFPFGEGLFETFRFQDEHLFYFANHWERLARSCRALGYSFPFLREDIQNRLCAAVRNEKKQKGIVRLTYRYHSGTVPIPGFSMQGTVPEALFFQILPPRPVPDSWSLLPQKISPHPKAGFKITDRNLYEEKRQIALEAGASDVLFLTPQGEILESSRANIFLVKNGELFSPPCAGKLLPGIMRRFVIDRAKALHIPVNEEPIFEDFFSCAEEIFLTNSVMGVVPVAEVHGYWKAQELSGEVTRLLSVGGRSQPSLFP